MRVGQYLTEALHAMGAEGLISDIRVDLDDYVVEIDHGHTWPWKTTRFHLNDPLSFGDAGSPIYDVLNFERRTFDEVFE